MNQGVQILTVQDSINYFKKYFNRCTSNCISTKDVRFSNASFMSLVRINSDQLYGPTT